MPRRTVAQSLLPEADSDYLRPLQSVEATVPTLTCPCVAGFTSPAAASTTSSCSA
jgi:hypothetical protein